LERPVGKAFADKHRSAGVVTGELLVGHVDGATVLIVDDLVSTGGTLARAAKAAAAACAARVTSLAALGLFMPGSSEALATPDLERIAVLDTVPPFRLAGSGLLGKVDVLPSAPLLAEAIRRLATDRALSDLLVF